MHFQDYLQQMIIHNASDLYLSGGAKPSIRIHGKIQPVLEQVISSETIHHFAHDIMTEGQWHEFELRPEMNLAMSHEGGHRFRVNIFRQRDEVAMVIRHIHTDIPTFEELKLPSIFNDLTLMKRGLILLVGATSSGKSTTLAAMLDYRNRECADHIITIEDPIEFVYEHKTSVVNQREVGMDTHDYADALKNTLRQAPDVIQIGEIRSRDTMEYALAYAETGHLCLSTLHANNTAQAVDRIVNFFPGELRTQLLLDLSLNLRAIVSQRLVPAIDGTRALALEILLVTPLVGKLIKSGEIHRIKEVMAKSSEVGMLTFDNALIELVRSGRISEEEAINHADSANNVRLALSMNKTTNGHKLKLSMKGAESEQTDRKKFLAWMNSSGGEREKKHD